MPEMLKLTEPDGLQKTADNGQAPSIDTQPDANRPVVWKRYEIVAFRIAFIFFIIMSIPWSGAWYGNLFSSNWAHLHYRDLYDIARFQPNFTGGGGEEGRPALYGYADWLIVLAVAVVGAIVWGLADKKRKEYVNLHYWLRVIVRYRAAIGIIGFAYTKVLPVQMPYPSLGLLNTNFGDFTAQKIYWLSIGIVPWYQVFAGVVELTAGVLLLFRRTTTLGAIMLFGALGDIVYVNFAYDGGVHVYSTYFVIFAAFLLAPDLPKIYSLLIQQRFTLPARVDIAITSVWLKRTRIALKTITIGLFIFGLFYLQLVNFLYDPYKQPAAKGVSELRGNYHVAEFRINGKLIPESPLDSVRWQEVTFENWTTLTFTVNKPVQLDLSNGGGSPMRDINRTFELTGVAGGRRVFYYEADTVNRVLHLQDKNRAGLPRASINDQADQTGSQKPVTAGTADFLTAEQEYKLIDERALSVRRLKGIDKERSREVPRKTMTLNYKTAGGAKVILSGINEQKDSVYMVLNRLTKHYTLQKSSLSAGKYE